MIQLNECTKATVIPEVVGPSKYIDINRGDLESMPRYPSYFSKFQREVHNQRKFKALKIIK